MATQKQVLLLGLFAILIAAASFLCANASNPEAGLNGRKLLSGNLHTDYTPPHVHPPDYDYPPPLPLSFQDGNVHIDYTPPQVHPPDYDYPPPAPLSFQDAKVHIDYTPPQVHPPDYDYPPLAANFRTDNHCSVEHGCRINYN